MNAPVWVAHVDDGLVGRRGIHDYDISPMYTIAHDHTLGLLFALVALLTAWLRSGSQPTDRRAAIALLAATGAGHIGLGIGHDPGWRTVGFIAFGTWALWAARGWTISGNPPRGTTLGLSSSLAMYIVVIVSGEAPDQAGLILKLIEIACIGLLVGFGAVTKTHRLRQSTAIVGGVVLLGVGSWIGAFTGGGHTHTLGETPAPGLALPILTEIPPDDPDAAAALYEATVAHLAQYEDISVAAAAGYSVDGMERLGGHADNPLFKDDDGIFDPERPETLVYGTGTDGPILLGAMYQTDGSGEPGPMTGGGLTVWHAHDHVCFSVLPPGLGSLSSPFGMCPLGTVTVALTNEMIHVWTIDGAPDHFGELSEEWLAENLP